MIKTIILILIYLAFISLGLPDGLLGAAWPSMYPELGVSVSFAGYLSMIIAGGTIISSLFSSKLIQKIGTGPVVVISIVLTCLGLFGFYMGQEYYVLCLFAIPYGLGAGAIDSALNNYVAVHYKARHMSWLHCFWGVGALTGPYIVGAYLLNGASWRYGYFTIALIQSVLALILLCTLPLWKKNETPNLEAKEESEPVKKVSFHEALSLKGAPFICLAFFAYCALETTCGLWTSSYLTLNRSISADTAALWASLFYIGITGGRFLSGFVTEKLGDKKLIIIGISIIFVGLTLLAIPSTSALPLIGLVIIGLGCAPIYPSLIHLTPLAFGKDNSQTLIGLEMATAYVGSTFMPPLFGLLAEKVDILYFPYWLIFFALLLMVFIFFLFFLSKKQDKNELPVASKK
jgi:fucose permease